MAKKQKSFYLEEDVIKYIIGYQEKHNLSSPNVALDRIITAVRNNYPINTDIDISEVKIHETGSIKKELPKSMLSARASMKD